MLYQQNGLAGHMMSSVEQILSSRTDELLKLIINVSVQQIQNMGQNFPPNLAQKVFDGHSFRHPVLKVSQRVMCLH